ncbi:hypothetical protein WGT02_10185 [Rhizobium sp. T1470]|uniref:hypothetical protein n=1 Tax=unclassified Rhizobium TaxID=2613769 RepID=UPI001AAE2676|nr:hypothetical protein [Rhizobium sp. T1473]MCA0801624.1 hypothetical protein [Rhizobium sp. T1473]
MHNAWMDYGALLGENDWDALKTIRLWTKASHQAIHDKIAARLKVDPIDRFSLQFMPDTSLSDKDRFPLKLSDLIVMGLNPKKAPREIVRGSGPDQVIEKLPIGWLRRDNQDENARQSR